MRGNDVNQGTAMFITMKNDNAFLNSCEKM